MRLMCLLGLVVSVILAGCGGGVFQYRSVGTNPILMSHHKLINIYVSDAFNLSERKVIADSINEWNYALNNSMRLEIKQWNVDAEAQKKVEAEIERTGNGIMISGYDADDPALQKYKLGEGVLAFSVGIGNSHSIVVIRDRIGGSDFKVVILHEEGHALGAYHSSAKQNLMFPYGEVPYSGSMQSPCIDKGTLSQVAGYQHLDMRYLNYCSTTDFP